jgi:hypothetical protein
MLDICIIIDADIYGIIPRAKIPNLESAPPENK